MQQGSLWNLVENVVCVLQGVSEGGILVALCVAWAKVCVWFRHGAEAGADRRLPIMYSVCGIVFGNVDQVEVRGNPEALEVAFEWLQRDENAVVEIFDDSDDLVWSSHPEI